MLPTLSSKQSAYFTYVVDHCLYKIIFDLSQLDIFDAQNQSQQNTYQYRQAENHNNRFLKLVTVIPSEPHGVCRPVSERVGVLDWFKNSMVASDPPSSVFTAQTTVRKCDNFSFRSFINHTFLRTEEFHRLQALVGHHVGNGLHLEVATQRHYHVPLKFS